MDEYDLDRMIMTLGENAPQNEAYFGLTNDDYPDIEANKAGLLLFARQLLKATRLFEDRKNNENKSIRIDHGDWCKLFGLFESVEPVYDSRYEFLQSIKKPSRLSEIAKGIFSIAFFIMLIFLIIVGSIQVFNWWF
ncbi:hypothetical protein [Winogradskyella sp. A3E31]|uniref:hypothetical protein n=1 Tax=Winogradskyella sp. A3E31 TaxID=3349637 RepID=UPI00398A82F6